MIRRFVRDVHYGLRSIRRNPLFSAVVVATLGLGIGANTMVFSAVDGVVLNPFPFPQPERLVGVGTVYPRLGTDLGFWENLSPPEYRDIAEGSRALEGVVAWDMGNRQVTFGERTENLFSAFWWGDAFPTLGVRPALGRAFRADELERGDRVAILSHRVWQDRFGGDPGLVGGTILMNGDPYTVVGIMAERTLIYGTDLWLPMGVSPSMYARNRRQFQVIARLAPGQTLESANADLHALAGRVEREYGTRFEEYAGWELRALTWNEINVRTLKPAAMVLLFAVMFVLLLVCANVSSLLLARGTSRNREIAVRSALGAGRRHIIGQLLTESVMLAMAGGVVGALVGVAGVSLLTRVADTLGVPVPGEVVMNLRVLGFTALVSTVAGLVFGAVPAMHVSRTELSRTLQADGPSMSAGRSSLRLQRVLVGAEVTLAVSLLAGAGLLIGSYLNLGRVEPGFDPANVLTMRLTLATQRYEPERIEPFFRDLRERVGRIPGVESVATTSQVPPNAFSRNRFTIEGSAAGPEVVVPVAYTTLVSPAYFQTLRIPLIRGRTIEPTDQRDTPPVAVINDAAADRYFPGEDPVGKRIRSREGAPWIEIVGIVGSTRNVGLDRDPEPELFASAIQRSGTNNQMFLVIRTRVEPRSVLSAVRQAVAAIDPEQPVYAIRTLDEALADSRATRRLSTYSLGCMAAFALLLAAVGIYGVVAYAVGRRTREIGVRMALGAAPSVVLRLVIGQAMLPVGIGVIAGMAVALLIGRLLSGLLFGVSGSDPMTLVAASGLLAAAAILASWLPARRAVAVDPIRALRPE